MTKYENKTINKGTFVIEDSLFVNCVLTDCDVFYSGGDFEWTGVRFENCTWHFRGQAQKTVQLLQLLQLMKPQQSPLSSPVSNSMMN